MGDSALISFNLGDPPQISFNLGDPPQIKLDKEPPCMLEVNEHGGFVIIYEFLNSSIIDSEL